MSDARVVHSADLYTYDAVRRLTPLSRRPIYRTRYVVGCSCGWSVDAADWINAKRIWREHSTAPASELRRQSS